MTKHGGLELWEELAELASHEEDPEKLMALVTEINRLLDHKVAEDPVANENSENTRLQKEKHALLKDGSTKPDTE